MNNPFDKHIPSVFVICSPFQALCALAAIKNLEIANYTFFLIKGGASSRYRQLIEFVERHLLPYEEIVISTWFEKIWYYIKPLGCNKVGYRRLFVGDFRQHLFLRIGLCYVCDGSSVVYLDDGNATLALLSNMYRVSLKNKVVGGLNTLYLKVRRIERVLNVYSIYDDLKNPICNVEKNTIENVVGRKGTQERSTLGVYIVGPAYQAYCDFFQIPYDSFLKYLDNLLLSYKQKYPLEPFYFIAHGRDNGERTKTICDNNGVEFIRPPMMVELYMADLLTCPRLVVGFNSTALFNIKKMMPDCRVLNVLVTSKNEHVDIREHEFIADYYKRHGIEYVKYIVD